MQKWDNMRGNLVRKTDKMSDKVMEEAEVA